MPKMYNINTHEMQEVSANTMEFLNELEKLCRSHNISISHEDEHGGFILQRFSEENIKWIRSASLDL